MLFCSRGKRRGERYCSILLCPEILDNPCGFLVQALRPRIHVIQIPNYALARAVLLRDGGNEIVYIPLTEVSNCMSNKLMHDHRALQETY